MKMGIYTNSIAPGGIRVWKFCN